MRTILTLLVMAAVFIGCNNEKSSKQNQDFIEHDKEQAAPTKKKVLSPHTSTMAMIGDAHIHIDYSSPGVRGRIIFGGLVGYDVIWQAGAHNATWIETNKELAINGEILPKGKYGFFIIPSKEEWTVIINKNWDQHGKDDYDETDDVIRFKVAPENSKEIQEHLEYKVSKSSENSGTISMSWEKIKIKFPFTVN